MTKPTGDRLLQLDPAELWQEAQTPTEGESELHASFSNIVREIPQHTRDTLQAMHDAEYNPRDDGGLGYSAVDHLWQILMLNNEGIDPLTFGLSHSRKYILAMIEALELGSKAAGKKNAAAV